MSTHAAPLLHATCLTAVKRPHHTGHKVWGATSTGALPRTQDLSEVLAQTKRTAAQLLHLVRLVQRSTVRHVLPTPAGARRGDGGSNSGHGRASSTQTAVLW